tara:strand:+ start:65 stop:2254 length:2190 start_codon:yes stop_codon:yes gene_type:complete
MPIQQEIKSQLAKLLATEDLVVEHKQVETAQFNVDTRVLILPIWEKASNTVYDMLVGHEVGHALFTPNQDPPEDIPHSFINVVEDARIEKLIKRRYMGLAKTFYRAYNELNENDFFEIDGQDLDSFNLADRANLHFKIGSFLNISFTTREKEIINLIDSCQTFEDVISASRVLYEYCKEQQEDQQKKVADIDTHQNPSDVRPDLGQDTTEYEEDKDEDEEGETEQKSIESPQMEESGQDVEQKPNQGKFYEEDLEVKTAESLFDKLQGLTSTSGRENVYIELPKVNIDSIIASNKDVHQEIDTHFDLEQAAFIANGCKSRYTWIEPKSDNIFEDSDSSFVQFKRDAQKEVNYLVKEFECKKSASAYARATTSRTGVLDTSKLHTYKYNEDLFKKITVLPDGKNHGLVFILDWSGSMQYVLQDTLKQLYNLVWFCRKVSIPFEVYAFSNEWFRSSDMYGGSSSEGLTHHYEAKENLMVVDSHFTLMNILTSKVNAKTLEHQMINIWRLAQTFCGQYMSYTYPRRLSLSGTPLNESIIALHQILPHFQKENKVEKVQCIILTDGEASQIPYHMEVQRHWEPEPYMGSRNINPDTVTLRDRKLGTTYRFGYGYYEFTRTMINNLKDNFPTVNFIGIRVLPKRDGLRFAKMYHSEYSKEYGVIEKDWRKNKSYSIKNSGYDSYLVMASETLSDDTEFEPKSDSKADIKRAFVKSLKVKKLNKKVLGEFVQLVA